MLWRIFFTLIYSLPRQRSLWSKSEPPFPSFREMTWIVKTQLPAIIRESLTSYSPRQLQSFSSFYSSSFIVKYSIVFAVVPFPTVAIL